MSVPIDTAKKRPYLLVWINIITNREDENDVIRAEANAMVEVLEFTVLKS